ncbi:AraC family transcriptional regulator [Ruegeria atlantica]|nr:AraC family transcriptional regulator [Ruegeria atlantica]
MPINPIAQGQSEGFIRLALTAPFLHYLNERGINPQPALDQLGIQTELLSDPTVYLHSELVYGLLNAFSDLADDRYLGLHVGESFDLHGWPPFSQARHSSKTLFEFFARFVRLVPQESSSVRHRLIVDADKATYRITQQQEPVVPPVQVTGFGAAIYVRLLRAVVANSWDPLVVRWESRYINGVPLGYEGVEIGLGADSGMQFSFPVDWLFKSHSSDTTAEPKTAARQEEEITVVAAIRSVLRDKLDEVDLDPPTLARLLGLKPDRLLRALHQQGTTLPREVKRLKVHVAKELLSRESKTISEIGLMLGYSDKSHFTRFFRSQTGVTPTQFQAGRSSEQV